MLSIIAFSMVATFMTLIMTKRLSALIALILVPTLFALLAGFGRGLGQMMLAGVKDLAPTGVMLLFAILYFGLMIDAGLFDPLIKRIVRLVKGDPLKITMGTAFLALCVSLDGDGTTTYMITVSAMIPLYRHLKMDVRIMACLIMLSGSVMNVLPWGGPTARAASALKVPADQLFVPMIPAMITTACWVMFVAWILGRGERKRLAADSEHETYQFDSGDEVIGEDPASHIEARRPKLLWFNFLLTASLMVLLILGLLPLGILFMLAFAIAIMVNYPTLEEQRERLAAHAGNALSVVSLIFAAGIFVGVLSGTKMVDAMATSVIHLIPVSLGSYMAPITAALSAPFTFLISNDAFYFGMLPVLAETGSHYGVSSVDMARASLIGQQVHLLSPLVASTYLLVGLAGIELGEHQRFTIKWALGSFVVFFLSSLLFGIIPWTSG